MVKNGRDEQGKFSVGHTLNRGTYIIKPNLHMSCDLAYILGVIYGDGYVYRNNNEYIVGLHVVNRVFIEEFRGRLASIGLHPSKVYESIEQTSINGHSYQTKMYRVVAGSNMFGDFVKQLSYNDLYTLLLINKKFIYSFLKGIFESEGTVHENGMHGLSLVILYNTDKDLIELTNNLLKYLGYSCSVLINKKESKNRKRCYYVNITGGSKKKLELLKALNPVIKNNLIKIEKGGV